METVYYKYQKYRSDGIPFDDDFDIEAFFREENELLTQVYDEFGQFSAWKLRNMTREEAFWRDTPQTQVIPQSALKAYFEKEYLAS